MNLKQQLQALIEIRDGLNLTIFHLEEQLNQEAQIISKENLTEQENLKQRAKETKREYQREYMRTYMKKWRKENPDKVKAITERFWENKVRKQS